MISEANVRKIFYCLYYHKACHCLHYPEVNTIMDVIHSENEHILDRASNYGYGKEWSFTQNEVIILS